MGTSLKYDSPPLLAPGRHCLTLPEIYEMCVARFGYPKRRERLFYALEELLQRFLREKIPCEFWLDGSFLTEKPEPDDVDVVVRIENDVLDNLGAAARLLVDEANEAEYISGVDSFVFVSYPRDHPLFGTDVDERETWAEQYGLEHGEVWLKGIAILRLGETDVGLRIRR